MASTLVLLHTEDDGGLRRASLEALETARSLGGDLSIGIIGGKVEPALAQVAGSGASRVLVVDGEEFASSRYSTDAAAATAICEAVKANLVLAPGTGRFARCMAGVAQRMGGVADTHITGLRAEGDAVEASRWYYRQRIEAVIRRQQTPWFLVLESGAASAFVASGPAASPERLSVPVQPRSVSKGMVTPQSGEQTIRPEAELLFVAGAGWTKKQKDGAAHVEDAGKLILDFVRKAEASLGSSKSLVDLSGEGQAVLPFLSHLNQVGQTGSTPRHARGLATCCHGEEPHVVGWRFIQDRRAVNLDANCGWARGKADVLYVADAFQ